LRPKIKEGEAKREKKKKKRKESKCPKLCARKLPAKKTGVDKKLTKIKQKNKTNENKKKA